jgi:hypothetical protein
MASTTIFKLNSSLRRLFLLLFDLYLNHLLAVIKPAKWADTMRYDGLAAMRTGAEILKPDFPMRPALSSALPGMLPFW